MMEKFLDVGKLSFSMVKGALVSGSKWLTRRRFSRASHALAVALVLWCVLHSLNTLPFFNDLYGGRFVGSRWERDEGLYGFLFHILRAENISFISGFFILAQVGAAVLILVRRWAFSASLVFVLVTLNLFSALPHSLDGGNNLAQLLLYTLPLLTLGWHPEKPQTAWTALCASLENSVVILVRLQIAAVYLTAGLHKLNGRSWKEGTALYHIFQNPDFGTSWTMEFAHAFPSATVAMTYITVVFQCLFSILIWMQKFRLPLLLLGVMIHMGIAFGMGLFEFGLLMVVSYAVWVPESWYEALSKRPRPATLLVGFDERCGLCQRFAAFLFRNAKHTRIVVDNARAPGHAALQAIPVEHRIAQMHAISSDGFVFVGYDAVVEALAATSLRPLGPLMRLFGAVGWGRLVYRLVATSRKSCREGGCPLPSQVRGSPP